MDFRSKNRSVCFKRGREVGGIFLSGMSAEEGISGRVLSFIWMGCFLERGLSRLWAQKVGSWSEKSGEFLKRIYRSMLTPSDKVTH